MTKKKTSPAVAEWPSRFGTLGEAVFGKGDPFPDIPVGQFAKDAFYKDDCEPFQSMVDGKYFSSKSAYRRHLKAHGYIESGNESTAHTPSAHERQAKEKADQAQRIEHIQRATELVKNNMSPLSEYDRSRCKIINRNLENYNYDRRSRHPDDK